MMAYLFRRFALLVVLVLSAWAQQPEPPADQSQVPTFKSGVDVVNIFFTVRKGNTLVPNLKKQDFQVSEEGKPQTIKFFTAESNLPLTLGMMIDTSGSMQRVLGAEKELGSEFVKQTMSPKDLAFVINFDVNVELAQDMTSDPREIARAMNETKINVGGGFGGGVPGVGQGPVPIHRQRGTALYDAIYLASNDKLASEVGRKALIILTDGNDQGSKVNLRDAIEAAQRADAMCYVILVADPMFGGADSGDMEKLAGETGGRVIEVGTKPEKMKEAFDRISQELRSQYSIGYSPTNKVKDGSFRRVEIKTNAGKVQARRGYYALK
jgi:VWFA-related protein